MHGGVDMPGDLACGEGHQVSRAAVGPVVVPLRRQTARLAAIVEFDNVLAWLNADDRVTTILVRLPEVVVLIEDHHARVDWLARLVYDHTRDARGGPEIGI